MWLLGDKTVLQTLRELYVQFAQLADPQKAVSSAKFFKTAAGQYAEGDVFIGLTVPQQQKLAKQFINLNFGELQTLLQNPIHEYRLTALLILVQKFAKALPEEQTCIVEFYLQNTKYINNWDLVDCSCYKILGAYLMERDHRVLHQLAHSGSLWEQRIAIVTTYAFIKKGKFSTTLILAEALLGHKHDLLHKAVGWMLREVGKQNETVLKTFLAQHYKKMPRTTLRYAIERFVPHERLTYLSNKI
jgi:3-methyladenine DNA glycosylase AlkD